MGRVGGPAKDLALTTHYTRETTGAGDAAGPTGHARRLDTENR